MDKLIKLFPFMPVGKQTGKLVGAIIFYLFVPNLIAVPIATVVGFLLGLTVVLAPVGIVIGGVLGLVGFVYTVMGIVFAFMGYTGRKFD